MPWLMEAAFGVHTPIAEFMPRLRETALEARVPVDELGPWPRIMSLEARVLAVKISWLGETTLEALVPAAGTTP